MEEKFFYGYIERADEHLFTGLQVRGEPSLFLLLSRITVI
jgi:hypothetical protein